MDVGTSVWGIGWSEPEDRPFDFWKRVTSHFGASGWKFEKQATESGRSKLEDEFLGVSMGKQMSVEIYFFGDYSRLRLDLV